MYLNLVDTVPRTENIPEFPRDPDRAPTIKLPINRTVCKYNLKISRWSMCRMAGHVGGSHPSTPHIHRPTNEITSILIQPHTGSPKTRGCAKVFGQQKAGQTQRMKRSE